MPKDYIDWKKIVMMQDKPDLYVLNSFYHAVIQFRADPKNKAAKTVLDIATDCVKRYVGEEDKRYEDT